MPTPKTRSDLSRKCTTMSVVVLLLVPSDKGWVSGNALLPAMDVITGTPVSSANAWSFSLAVPLAYKTPWPA